MAIFGKKEEKKENMLDPKEIVGQVDAIFDGTSVVLDVHRDGTVILPDGDETVIDESILCSLVEQYDGVNGTGTALQPVSTIATDSALADATKPKEIVTVKKSFVFFAVAIVVFVLAITGILVLTNLPSLSGQITNEYKVAVAAVDIEQGTEITDDMIAFITLSADDFQSMVGTHFVNEKGDLIPDEPIFFVNRNKQIVEKFAASDIAEGTVILPSFITNTKSEEDVYVVETKDEYGETHTSTINGADLKGDVTIDYVAVIRLSDGRTYEINLSSIKLRDKTLNDVLSADGASLINNFVEADDAAESENTIGSSELVSSAVNSNSEGSTNAAE